MIRSSEAFPFKSYSRTLYDKYSCFLDETDTFFRPVLICNPARASATDAAKWSGTAFPCQPLVTPKIISLEFSELLALVCFYMGGGGAVNCHQRARVSRTWHCGVIWGQAEQGRLVGNWEGGGGGQDT